MKHRSLWQISVTLKREAEEAAAALLERLFGQPACTYAADGSDSSTVTIYSTRPTTIVRSKREALKSGLNFLATCELDIGEPQIVIRKVPRQDWATSWKKYFKTIEIGSALLIKPSWTKRRTLKGQAVVTLDPGLSFGTGQHPTTSYCLEELVKARKTGQEQSFLDIGTGSGILAIAAVKLGFKRVRAFDLDPTSIRVAKANAKKNRVEGKLAIVRGNLKELPVKSAKRYDVICANLVDDLLVSEASRLTNWLAPGGRLILAGILAHQFARVGRTFEQAGMELVRSRVEGGWQSGTFVGGRRRNVH